MKLLVNRNPIGLNWNSMPSMDPPPHHPHHLEQILVYLKEHLAASAIDKFWNFIYLSISSILCETGQYLDTDYISAKVSVCLSSRRFGQCLGIGDNQRTNGDLHKIRPRNACSFAFDNCGRERERESHVVTLPAVLGWFGTN